MRLLIATSLLVVTLGALVAPAEDSVPADGKTRPAPPDARAKTKAGARPAPRTTGDTAGRDARPERKDQSPEARESAALAFVRENHPELSSLLEQLKAMKPDQYERAIAELATISRNLANLKRNDERRYQLALEAWKTRSRAELIAAQLVGAPSPELESQLRAALENQIDVEIRQQRLERESAEARLRRANETIERLESQRDKLVESRYQTLLKKGQRARRLEAGRVSPSKPNGAKGDD